MALIDGGANIEASDGIGRKPLHNAAQAGWDAVVEALIRAGAKVDARIRMAERLCMSRQRGATQDRQWTLPKR